MTISDNERTFGSRVVDFHHELRLPQDLPPGIEWINNLDQLDTQVSFSTFFNTYFSDNEKRLFLFGINPGRFGGSFISTQYPAFSVRLFQTSV